VGLCGEVLRRGVPAYKSLWGAPALYRGELACHRYKQRHVRPHGELPHKGSAGTGATRPGSTDSGPRRARPSAGTITCRFSCSFLEKNLKTFLLYNFFTNHFAPIFSLKFFGNSFQKLSKYFQKTLPLTCFTKVFIHKTFCVNNFV
jgi:hypothetical protein